MTSIETLRAALDLENEQLARDLAARDQAQLSLADAQEDLGIKEHRVGARYREINYLQGQIDELEAEDQANRPGPDEPTNIPDHAVPLTPLNQQKEKQLSKQVVVNTVHGKECVYDADRAFVEDGDLIVVKDDIPIAIHHDWAHAKVVELVEQDAADEPETVVGHDPADPKQRLMFSTLVEPVQDFRDALAQKPVCTRLCCPSCCDKECK